MRTKKLHDGFPGDRVFLVLGLIIIGAIGIGIYFGIRYAVDVITGMDKDVARFSRFGSQTNSVQHFHAALST
jgi:hypothetical protein